MAGFYAMWETLRQLLVSPFTDGVWIFVFKFIPYVLFFELPMYLLILAGILRYVIRQSATPSCRPPFHPAVSCVITAYSEGAAVQQTIRSLAEQVYPGFIRIICVVDGASRNRSTLEAARQMEAYVAGLARRELTVVPKWQRGGRVSGLNTGLTLATTEVLMAMDGDTSFDNDMVAKAVGHFLDPEVVGVAGSLRVRNVAATLWTRLQAIEYALSIQSAKAGLSEFNVVNNISGAFGIFRIDLSQAFLQGCAALERTLAERKRGCYSRPTGRNFSRPSR